MEDGHDWKESVEVYVGGSLSVIICTKCKQLKTAMVKPCPKRNKP